MSYFDFLPDELSIQIFIYLDIDYLETLDSIPIVKKLFQDKLFWINKLNSQGFSDYVKYLGIGSFLPSEGKKDVMDNYLNNYYKIYDSANEAYFIGKSLEKYGEELRIPIKTTVQEFLSTDDLKELNDSIDIRLEKQSVIKFSRPLNAHKVEEWIVTYKPLESNKVRSFVMTDKEFDYFLTKLVLAGVDPIKFTDLETIFEDEASSYHD